MAQSIMNNKTQHAIKDEHGKYANKKLGVRDDTKTNEVAPLVLQNTVVLPPNFLECEASK